MRKFSCRTAVIISAAIIMSAKAVFAGEPPPPQVDVPTLTEWGMIATAVTLGAAGIYSILKKRK